MSAGAETTHDVPQTFPFPYPSDRRTAPRAVASGPLQAVLSNGRQLPWVMKLDLINASATGLCVDSPTPLEPGARLSLRVDPVHGNWRTGIVVRCKTNAPGKHQLGIAYEMRKAA